MLHFDEVTIVGDFSVCHMHGAVHIVFIMASFLTSDFVLCTTSSSIYLNYVYMYVLTQISQN